MVILTLNMLNCWWSRWNWHWNNNICCLSYTADTMPAVAPVNLGARPSARMVLTTPKPEYLSPASEELIMMMFIMNRKHIHLFWCKACNSLVLPMFAISELMAQVPSKQNKFVARDSHIYLHERLILSVRIIGDQACWQLFWEEALDCAALVCIKMNWLELTVA